MKELYYWVDYEGIGEIAISEETAELGLTIYIPELQGLTDEQLKEFANSYGDGYFERYPYTREDGLKFLAWYIDGDIADGLADLDEKVSE